MTEKDLRAQFKRETGVYTPNPESFKIELLDREEQDDLITYVEWLEEQIIKLEKENFQMKLEQNRYKGPIIH